jgi:MraZ protein
MLLFHGAFEQKIDEKGRVNVPIKFRETLRSEGEERLMITNARLYKVRCLDAYPYSAWVERVRQIKERATTLKPEKLRYYLSYYIPEVQECPIDKQGRVFIPTRLRDYAGLGRDILFTGVVDMIQIWDQAARMPVFSAAEEVADDPDFVPGFGF